MRRTGLTVAASVLLLLAFVFFVGPARLLNRLAGTDPGWFAAGLLLVALSLACWSQALRPLLAAAGGPVSARRTAVAFSASMCGRQLVPVGAVGGPAITAYAVDRESALSFDETLAVVTVAEFISTIASLALAAAGAGYLATTGSVDPHLRAFAAVSLAFAGGFAALAIAFWYWRGAVERAVLGAAWVARRVTGVVSPRVATGFSGERASRALGRYYGTLETVVDDPRSLVVSYLYHQLGWLCMAVALATSALALDVTLPLGVVLFVVPASLLVDVLPLPGGLGGIEFVLAGMLAVLAGLDLGVAAAVTLLYRVCSYWFVIALGGLAALYASVPVADFLDRDPLE